MIKLTVKYFLFLIFLIFLLFIIILYILTNKCNCKDSFVVGVPPAPSLTDSGEILGSWTPPHSLYVPNPDERIHKSHNTCPTPAGSIPTPPGPPTSTPDCRTVLENGVSCTGTDIDTQCTPPNAQDNECVCSSGKCAPSYKCTDDNIKARKFILKRKNDEMVTGIDCNEIAETGMCSQDITANLGGDMISIQEVCCKSCKGVLQEQLAVTPWMNWVTIPQDIIDLPLEDTNLGPNCFDHNTDGMMAEELGFPPYTQDCSKEEAAYNRAYEAGSIAKTEGFAWQSCLSNGVRCTDNTACRYWEGETCDEGFCMKTDGNLRTENVTCDKVVNEFRGPNDESGCLYLARNDKWDICCESCTEALKQEIQSQNAYSIIDKDGSGDLDKLEILCRDNDQMAESYTFTSDAGNSESMLSCKNIVEKGYCNELSSMGKWDTCCESCSELFTENHDVNEYGIQMKSPFDPNKYQFKNIVAELDITKLELGIEAKNNRPGDGYYYKFGYWWQFIYPMQDDPDALAKEDFLCQPPRTAHFRCNNPTVTSGGLKPTPKECIAQYDDVLNKYVCPNIAGCNTTPTKKLCLCAPGDNTCGDIDFNFYTMHNREYGNLVNDPIKINILEQLRRRFLIYAISVRKTFSGIINDVTDIKNDIYDQFIDVWVYRTLNDQSYGFISMPAKADPEKAKGALGELYHLQVNGSNGERSLQNAIQRHSVYYNSDDPQIFKITRNINHVDKDTSLNLCPGTNDKNDAPPIDLNTSYCRNITGSESTEEICTNLSECEWVGGKCMPVGEFRWCGCTDSVCRVSTNTAAYENTSCGLDFKNCDADKWEISYNSHGFPSPGGDLTQAELQGNDPHNRQNWRWYTDIAQEVLCRDGNRTQDGLSDELSCYFISGKEYCPCKDKMGNQIVSLGEACWQVDGKWQGHWEDGHGWQTDGYVPPKPVMHTMPVPQDYVWIGDRLKPR